MTHRRTRRGAAVAVLLLTSPAWTAPPADRSSDPPIEPASKIVTEHELAVSRAAANASRSLDGKPMDDMPAASPDVESEAAEASDAPGHAAPTEEAVPPTPGQETRALGLPNGTLSARPVDSETTTSWLDDPLAALDPRRNEVVRVGGALVAVLALLVLLRVMLRRSAGPLAGGARPAGVLEVLARYPIARGQSLIVLKLARRILLVHQSGTGMTTLSEMTDADEVAGLLGRMEAGSRSRDATRFRSTLARFEREHGRLAELAAGNADGRSEVVDLTRRRGLGRRLRRRRVSV